MIRLILLIAWWMAFGAAMYADEPRGKLLLREVYQWDDGRKVGLEEYSYTRERPQLAKAAPAVEYKQFGGYWYKSTGGDWFLCAECNPQLGGGQTIGLPGPSPMSPPPLYYVPNYSAVPNSSRGFGAGFSFGIGGG